MQILFCLKTRNMYIIVLVIHDFNIDEAFASHYCLHEAEIEAPNHNDAENDAQRCHYNPVIDIVYLKDEFLLFLGICTILLITFLIE